MKGCRSFIMDAGAASLQSCGTLETVQGVPQGARKSSWVRYPVV